MSAPIPVVAVLTLLAALGLSAVAAEQLFQSRIPNGDRVPNHPGVGHIARDGGGARNQFGLDFENAGFQWTSALCHGDSDGDGQSNGFELGDPGCTWVPGRTPTRTSGISDPSLASSTSPPPPPSPSPASTTKQPPSSTATTSGPQTYTPVPASTTSSPTTDVAAPGALLVFPGVTFRWAVASALGKGNRAQGDQLIVTITSETSHDWVGFGRASQGMDGVQIACSVYPDGTGDCLDLQADSSYVVARRTSVTTVLNTTRSAGGFEITLQTPVSSFGPTAQEASRTIFAHGPGWSAPVDLPTPHALADTLIRTVDFYAGVAYGVEKRRWNWIALGVAVGVMSLLTLVGVVLHATGVVASDLQRSLRWGLAYLLLLGLWVMVIVVSWAGYRKDGATAPAGRAFGDGATFLFFVVLWPTARHIGPVPLLGYSYERFLTFHSTVGTLILISLTVHFGVMWDSFAKGGQAAARRYILSWDSSAPRITVAGFVAWLVLLVVIISTFFRRISFSFFKAFHALFIVVIVFGAIHHPPLWLLAGPGLATYLADIGCRIASHFRAGPVLLEATYHEKAEITELVIRVRHFALKPCQFAFLRFSDVGGLYHPFSIADCRDGGKVRFFVKACGGWTRKLATLAMSNGATALGSVLWLGPYGELEVPLSGVSTVACVCGGVGVTPLMSLLQYIAMRPPEAASVKSLLFVWVVRSVAMAKIIGPIIDGFLDSIVGSMSLTAAIHLTGVADEDMPSFRNIQLHHGRPDLAAALGCLSTSSHGRVACYLCGPATLSQHAASIAASNGMAVHTEVFEL